MPKLTIEDIRGVWKADLDGRCEFADTLEELMLKIAPFAPEDYLWHTAEVLGALLGAEVVAVPQFGGGLLDWGEILDALTTADSDEASQARDVPGEE